MPATKDINGSGSIGRFVFRAAIANLEIKVKAMSDPLMDLKFMVYRVDYDSVHNGLPGTIATERQMARSSWVSMAQRSGLPQKEPANISWSKHERSTCA